jgi:cell division protein FtsI/penicillin-binding protein 2
VRLIERRIGLLFAVFLFLLCAGAARAAWLSVVKRGTLERAAVTQQQADVVVPARRGAITDDHGVDLAVSEPAFDVAATPYLIKNPTAAAAKLAPLLHRPEDTLLRALARRDTGFAYLARRVPAQDADRAMKLKLEGLQFIPRYRRVYPRDWMASQLLGSVGTDGQGLSGLEYRLEKALRGQDGERRLVKDALGQSIRMRDIRPERAGTNVHLTLDANLQDEAEQVLAEVGQTWQPKGATAIVMDPRSGALLALANWPRVNANDPYNAPQYAQEDRATEVTYEPGSTFKAFTVAAALEDHLVTPDTLFHLPPVLPVADRQIHDAEDHGYVSYTTRQILQVSSNIGAVMIGERVGKAGLDSWIRKFGFGKPTGVDLPGEEAGILLPLRRWSDSTIGNVPIGQGIAVTPIQMAAAYAAIANGGILRAPHIVAAVGARRTRTPRGHRVISEATAASIRSMLEGVLGPGGTASGAAIPGYVLAGKTGTAQKPIPGGYSKDKYVASFVGFAPARDPKLLALIMVDEPKGQIYGGEVAAPAWRKITSFALNYLKIPPG